MSNDIKELIDQIRYNNRKSGWSDIDKMMDEAAEALENLDAQLDACVAEDINKTRETEILLSALTLSLIHISLKVLVKL